MALLRLRLRLEAQNERTKSEHMSAVKFGSGLCFALRLHLRLAAHGEETHEETKREDASCGPGLSVPRLLPPPPPPQGER